MSTLLFIVMYAVILLLLFLPLTISNRRKRKKTQEMLDNLKIGSKIQTIGGIQGEIVKILDQIVEIKICKGVTMKISKGAVAKVLV